MTGQLQVHASAVKENDIEHRPVENHFPSGNMTMFYVGLLEREENNTKLDRVWGCEQ